jgi:hypothetical protein
VISANDAPGFNTGSYTTAEAVVLDKEDLDKSRRSSGSEIMQSTKIPDFSPGYFVRNLHILLHQSTDVFIN